MFTILTVICSIIVWNVNRPVGGLRRRPSRSCPPIRARHGCEKTVRVSPFWAAGTNSKIVKNPSGKHTTEKHHV